MQTGAVVDAVGKEATQPGKQLVDGLNDQHSPIAILDIGGMHLGTDQQTASIGHNVALPPPAFAGAGSLTFLAASPGSRLCRARGQAPPRGPPLSVVLTD